MENRDVCRQAAAECLEIANTITARDARERLIILSAKFLDIANGPGDDDAFQALIDEFNDYQMRK